MIATRTIPERRRLRIQSPPKHADFPRHERYHEAPSAAGDEMWWGHEVHPEIHGVLRGAVELVLWLVTMLAIIWLFAEFWG